MSRVIFIGDVHGCIDELNMLIEQVSPTSEDQLVFVGDLLHKGPDSEAVLKLVLELRTTYKVDIICGNHEEKHLRWLRAEEQRLATGAANKMSHVEEYPLITISDQARELMSTSRIASKYGNFTAVHAGIPANLCELKEPTYNEWLKLPSKDRKAIGQVMRVRFLAGPDKVKTNSKGKTKQVPEGSMVPLGEQEPGDPYWADVYDGRFGTVVFGHNPFMTSEPVKFKHGWGIDLGCVHGGYLCALIVERDSVSYSTVKAKQTYKPRAHWIYDKH